MLNNELQHVYSCLGKCMYLLQWNIQCKQNFYVVTIWMHIFSKVPTCGQLAIGTNRVPMFFPTKDN